MQTKRRMHWVYYFGRFMIRFLTFFFISWKVKGKENIPEDKPVLIVCNHLHLADPPMIAASIPVKCKIMAKEDLWHNKWSRFWVSNFGAFPVRRGEVDMEAIRTVERSFQDGFSIMIFPEGGRSPEAKMRPALPGAALIASHMKATILPVGIAGSETFNHMVRTFFKHPTVAINIGKPFTLPPHSHRPAREERRAITDYIMTKVAELLPPEYRGVYGTENTRN